MGSDRLGWEIGYSLFRLPGFDRDLVFRSRLTTRNRWSASDSDGACSASLVLVRISGPSDRWWCGLFETSLGHHPFQILTAEAVTQIPAHAQQMTLLEGAVSYHGLGFL
jgi:hypothetical protein